MFPRFPVLTFPVPRFQRPPSNNQQLSVSHSADGPDALSSALSTASATTMPPDVTQLPDWVPANS